MLSSNSREHYASVRRKRDDHSERCAAFLSSLPPGTGTEPFPGSQDQKAGLGLQRRPSVVALYTLTLQGRLVSPVRGEPSALLASRYNSLAEKDYDLLKKATNVSEPGKVCLEKKNKFFTESKALKHRMPKMTFGIRIHGVQKMRDTRRPCGGFRLFLPTTSHHAVLWGRQ